MSPWAVPISGVTKPFAAATAAVSQVDGAGAAGGAAERDARGAFPTYAAAHQLLGVPPAPVVLALRKVAAAFGLNVYNLVQEFTVTGKTEWEVP